MSMLIIFECLTSIVDGPATGKPDEKQIVRTISVHALHKLWPCNENFDMLHLATHLGAN